MNEVRLRGFRCFRDEQKARLAPLTLLVGENSTGKTSFLALIRALWDLGYRNTMPDFKEEPYDLGSFDEIAHHRGAKGSRVATFEAGYTASFRRRHRRASRMERTFDYTIGRDRNQPTVRTRRIQQGDTFIELDSENSRACIGTANGCWHRDLDSNFQSRFRRDEHSLLVPLSYFLHSLLFDRDEAASGQETEWVNAHGPSRPSRQDAGLLRRLAMHDRVPPFHRRPYASAPVRSKPRRTYDPSRLTRDPEGEAVPMYLADLFHRGESTWPELHDELEQFGQVSGLFDEMRVRRLGKTSSEPFQIQVRKSGGRQLKGPWRNLTDVGYGVSQVLPVITELLRSDASNMFLLQQPEVHLHPSAQAALGTLFCRVASCEKQLIVETHGDHLIDRVRMDVRDGTTDLKPEDVSILFFERAALEVDIHSLRVDAAGNIVNAPSSYRQFFMEETNRSIGL